MSMFFQFEDKNTFLHTLHPTTKIVLFLSCVMLASLWWDMRYLAVLLVVIAVEVYICGIPRSWLKSGIVVALLGLPVMLPTALLSTNSLTYHVLPQSFVSHTVWVIVPKSHSFTGYLIGFTYGNLYWMAAFELRLMATFFTAMVFVYTMSSSDLVQWLLRRGVPYAVGYVVMIVLKFIPILIEDTKRIIWAQKLRGWEITSRNPVNVVQQVGPIVMPLTGRVLRLIDDTELSAVSRGFGLSKGVAILSFKARRRDSVISIIAGSLAIVAVIALILHNAGSI